LEHQSMSKTNGLPAGRESRPSLPGELVSIVGKRKREKQESLPRSMSVITTEEGLE